MVWPGTNVSKQEARVDESEERLRRITDNMLDMVCQTDARGIVRYKCEPFK